MYVYLNGMLLCTKKKCGESWGVSDSIKIYARLLLAFFFRQNLGGFFAGDISSFLFLFLFFLYKYAYYHKAQYQTKRDVK